MFADGTRLPLPLPSPSLSPRTSSSSYLTFVKATKRLGSLRCVATYLSPASRQRSPDAEDSQKPQKSMSSCLTRAHWPITRRVISPSLNQRRQPQLGFGAMVRCYRVGSPSSSEGATFLWDKQAQRLIAADDLAGSGCDGSAVHLNGSLFGDASASELAKDLEASSTLVPKVCVVTLSYGRGPSRWEHHLRML